MTTFPPQLPTTYYRLLASYQLLLTTTHCVLLTTRYSPLPTCDRIRVLEADGQLRREHAKKIEHKLDEHARSAWPRP